VSKITAVFAGIAEESSKLDSDLQNLWYVRLGPQVQPMKLDNLRELAAAGKIGPQTSVRQGGSTTWVNAADCEWYKALSIGVETNRTTTNDGVNPLVTMLRNEYVQILSELGSTIPTLIEEGQEFRALEAKFSLLSRLKDTRDTLESLYSRVYFNSTTLKHFGSLRVNMLGHELLPTRACLEDSGLDAREIYQCVEDKLHRYGLRKEHWCIDRLVLMEIEYMLDVLEIIIEPSYIPANNRKDEDDDQVEDTSCDRYISSVVKREVWRRDQGKCVQCGSQERLEYDHVIPVAQGGSNTARNIQLLCERCNRQKGARIE
jgi:hypothetical protein